MSSYTLFLVPIILIGLIILIYCINKIKKD